jgi:predicted GTPase
MAIDKTKTKDLIEQITVLFDSVASGLPAAARNWLRDQLLGAALGEIEELVEQARPPVLYLIGRSGHGKSSLINALSGRGAATVGDVRPTTPESETYTIAFPDSFATWRVVDSRGIFETTAPDGGPAADVVDLLKRDIAEKKPDLVLHVIASRELRNLSNDGTD